MKFQKSKLLIFISIQILLILLILNSKSIEFSNKSFNISTAENSDSWTKRLNVLGLDWASGVAIDSFDNIYVLGGTENANYERSYFLAKFNNSGNLLWQHFLEYNDSFSFYYHTIKINEYNEIYLAGNLELKGEQKDYLILSKYDDTGTQIWNKTWGGYKWFQANDMDIDSLGNIYIVGSIEIDPSNHLEAYLVKLDNSGTILWNYTSGEEIIDVYDAVVSSMDNIVYVSGEYNYTSILIKYNSSGSHDWNYTWNFFYLEHDLTVDSEGNVLIVDGTLLTKINSTGALLWNYSLPKFSMFKTSLITDSLNDIYIVENRYIKCYDNFYFIETGCICTAIYLEKINSSGSFLWEKWCTGCADASCSDIAMDSTGNLFITGQLKGEFGCTNRVNDAILMKNPKAFVGECIEIYYDLLFLILTPIILVSVIILIIFIRRRKSITKN